MTIFVILAAALVLLALVLVAPSLLRNRASMVLDRNQQNVVIAQERLSELEADLGNGVLTREQFEQAKVELEQALLEDLRDDPAESASLEAPKKHGRIALGVLAVTVPVLTVSLYLFLGEPQMVEFDRQQIAAQQNVGHGGKELPPVEDMVDSLVSHLKQQPDDAEGWFLLGRTYMMLKDYPKAVQAFDSAYELVGDVPAAMLSLADALAMVSGGNMAGRPTELIRKAVVIAPQDTTALWLAGLVEKQEGNLEGALTHFRNLKPQLAGEPDSLERINGFIAELEQQLGQSAGGAVAAADTATPEPVSAASAVGIKVSVSLSAEMQQKANPEQTVFIYAKALQGPPMPLAAAKHKVKDLPLEVVLDDTTAMMPQMKLSNFDQVTVGARISLSGNPIAQTGDLSGEVSPVAVQPNAAVDIVIDSAVQ
jgi:cytochrome c-type biogenesis protein CcmH